MQVFQGQNNLACIKSHHLLVKYFLRLFHHQKQQITSLIKLRQKK